MNKSKYLLFFFIWFDSSVVCVELWTVSVDHANICTCKNPSNKMLHQSRWLNMHGVALVVLKFKARDLESARAAFNSLTHIQSYREAQRIRFQSIHSLHQFIVTVILTIYSFPKCFIYDFNISVQDLMLHPLSSSMHWLNVSTAYSCLGA